MAAWMNGLIPSCPGVWYSGSSSIWRPRLKPRLDLAVHLEGVHRDRAPLLVLVRGRRALWVGAGGALDGGDLRRNEYKARASKAHDPHGGQRAPRDREHHDALLSKRPAGQSPGPFRAWTRR
jgi:hypothetical protein